MTKRIMQLQVLNPHARVFAVEAGKRNHWPAELVRGRREVRRSPLASAYRNGR